jgi:hypothetical protein
MQARASLFSVLLAIFIHGCATSRGVLDVRVPAVRDPSEGRVVKITRVIDSRAFTRDPPQPSMPSLMQGEIYDPAVTKRAIARKRNTYGKAMGDILLPEGRSVTQLVKETLTSALRRAGYRVAEPGDPDDAQAHAIEANVRQFWSWMTPGFSRITLNFEATVVIRDAGSDNARALKVSAAHVLKSPVADTEAWAQVVDGGLKSLSRNLARTLRPRPSAELENLVGRPAPEPREATSNQPGVSAAADTQTSGGSTDHPEPDDTVP